MLTVVIGYDGQLRWVRKTKPAYHTGRDDIEKQNCKTAKATQKTETVSPTQTPKWRPELDGRRTDPEPDCNGDKKGTGIGK